MPANGRDRYAHVREQEADIRKLRIVIIDLVTKGESRSLYARFMHANLASIMPQIIGVWSEQAGHHVSFICYTGIENLLEEIPEDIDVAFIGAFTQSAQMSYALSALCRSRGAVTVLGGPHARCYPEDAVKYFDYVLGFTNKSMISELLANPTPNRPLGVVQSAPKQPLDLPGVEERWKFIEQTMEKAPWLKVIPMIGSMGCPYTCSFCIDATVDYEPLSFEVLKSDLRFLRTKYKRPAVAWHDPNFGVRFDDYMDAIEEAIPLNSIDFIAESSLSLLSEPHLKRMAKNGFKAILPGIESWYELGNKSKTGRNQGLDKVKQVSEHVNMILEYIPYIQTNFVLGLDCDEGEEPFELTKRFIDLAPGAFPGYSQLTSFGRAAPLNLEYQSAERLVPFPFHFMNNNHAMNVRPKNYQWLDFYDHLIDVTKYSFSWRAIHNRYKALSPGLWRWMNVLRAVSSEGFGRIKYYTTIREMLHADRQMRRFFEQETTELPPFYVNRVKADLGALWHWLPEGALYHDPYAYIKSQEPQAAVA